VSLAPDDETDEVLMVRFQRGDRVAFTRLVRRHQTPLFNFALRQLGVHAVAEEVVQEAFVRVVQNATEFKHEARLTTWVYTILRNLCIDQLRRRALRRHPSLDAPRAAHSDEEDGPTLLDQTADKRASVEREAAGTELKERLARAVEALPDEQKEVFLLRELSNLPFKEIAIVTGTPENTVKSRMRYALERLQQALCEYEEYARALR